MNNLNRLLARKGAALALYTVIALILINTVFTYLYKKSLNDNISEHQRLSEVKKNKEAIISNLNNIDMSLRGFLLVGNEAFVDTYEKVRRESAQQMAYLRKTLPEMGITAATLRKMEEKQANYFRLMDEVIALEKSGDHTRALEIIKQDHGTGVWMTYVELGKEIDPQVQSKADRSDQRYQDLLSTNLFFQVLLFVIGTPTLLYTGIALARNEKARLKLYKNLDQSNRSLIFDSSEQVDITNEGTVINSMINNLNKASLFIRNIASGNYDVKWDGFSQSNADNKDAIAGQLLYMRDEMKRKREELERQQWVSDGLNELNNVIREHQADFRALTDKTTSYVIKYLGAQQGSLFCYNDLEGDAFLELVSTYAFDKKKYLEQRIAPGQGIIGQTYFEGEPVYLTNIPDDHIKISSGLGEARPTCLCVHPLKHNETIVAIIEIASFEKLDPFAQQFLSGACKNLGAAIMNIRANEKTKILLEAAQQHAEQMRAQEEELRQNMEELEATQEEMRRRESELKSRLDQQQVWK